MTDKFEESGWGNINFFQLKNGYKYSIDTVLLASFIKLKNKDKIIDLGSGEAIIPLFLNHRKIEFEYTGIEIQPELVELGKKNLTSVDIQGKIIEGNYENIERFILAQDFDVAVINPPYYKLGTGKTNPDPIELIARHEVKGSVSKALNSAKYALRNKGKVFLIYPASRISTLFKNLAGNGFEPKIIIPVYSGRDMVCNFMLVNATKNGGEECKILPPLFIYENTKKKIYSKQIRDIFDSLEMKY